MDSTSFSFNGEYFEQVFGMPMGSPLSPILFNIVIEDSESHCHKSLPFEIRTYCRYVDDILMIVPRDRVNEVLNCFNSYHPRLQFTHEIEVNGQINFLDTTVIRMNNNLITNWYRKTTFSGRYIYKLCFQPSSQI